MAKLHEFNSCPYDCSDNDLPVFIKLPVHFNIYVIMIIATLYKETNTGVSRLYGIIYCIFIQWLVSGPIVSMFKQDFVPKFASYCL
jgi:peptidoglycan biosynthesis protein MviN/MurJ (putative lipid II flippase)